MCEPHFMIIQLMVQKLMVSPVEERSGDHQRHGSENLPVMLTTCLSTLALGLEDRLSV